MEQDKSKKDAHDKIINNDYNTGNLDYVNDSEIVLNTAYQKDYLQAEYNMEEHHRLEELCELLYKHIEKSKFRVLFESRRIIKKVVPEILEYILPFLDKQKNYSFAEKFYAISSLLDIKESIIYQKLPSYYKDLATDELQGYVDVHKKRDGIRIIPPTEDLF